MCGIVGFFQPNHVGVSTSEVIDMRNIIRHRGPDDAGIYVDDHIGLGHVRLAILDLSSLAAQPMRSGCGRYVLAYNGEVYNFPLLRQRLIDNGLALRSTGDTEAILEYIARFGLEQCLQAMEGMFAFALWDRQEHTLVLARDRHGIKPLYYAAGNDGRIGFASEMKALIGLARGPDETSINATMLGLGCAFGSQTLLKGIDSVRPGEFIRLGRDRSFVKQFFFRLTDFIDPQASRANELLSPREAVGKVHAALKESMRLCMISDAPVAVLASGGVDSSLIAAIAKQAHPNLQLYHANVEGASETSAAEALANHLGCKLSSASVSPQDTLEYTPVVTYHYEMPLMYHTNAVPFYLVSRLAASQGIKVVLTGEGSDEYFIGYAQMAIFPLIQRYRRLVDKIQSLVHTMPQLGKILWPRTGQSLPEQLRHLLFRYELQERREEAAELYHFIRNPSQRLLQVMSLDMCEGNIPPLLHRNDRLGMAWGLESRFPFLGHAIAGLALNLPPKFKVRLSSRMFDRRHPFVIDKWCIRQIAAEYLPRGLAHRGKYAFRATAYDRLNLQPEFFDNGFAAELYGLDKKGIRLMLKTANVPWRQRMFLLENWGRIFCRRETPERVREHICRTVGLN